MIDDEPHEATKKRARAVNRALAKLYPDAACTLDHRNPFELLVATILSAQCTDARVNKVTPALFARFPDPASMAAAPQPQVEELIRSAGFYRNKAKNIQATSAILAERYAGEVPRTLEELVTLPGVARKTANVVLGDAFGVPGITVDTHVGRLSRRMGFTPHHDPVKAEFDLNALLPAKDWTVFCHRMIEHGRAVCNARGPACDGCGVRKLCPRIGVAP